MPGFVHCERVRFSDLDAMRHVNNVVFLRWFETARIIWLRGLGIHDPVNEAGTGFGLIFAECHIKYRSPVQFDEQIDIELAISDIQRSSFRVPFAMRVGERVCAEGYGVFVGFNYAEQRAAPFPEALRSLLEAEAVSA